MWRSYECKRKSRDIGPADNILLKGKVCQGPAKQSALGTGGWGGGGGGATTQEGGACEVLPLRKRVGQKKF